MLFNGDFYAENEYSLYFSRQATPEERLKNDRERYNRFAISLNPLEAWLIVNGHSDCINQKSLTIFRGPIYIHATRKCTPMAFGFIYKKIAGISDEIAKQVPTLDHINRNLAGGIVGKVEIDKMFMPTPKDFTSFWHTEGSAGWHVCNATSFDRIPCKGVPAIFPITGIVNQTLDDLKL